MPTVLVSCPRMQPVIDIVPDNAPSSCGVGTQHSALSFSNKNRPLLLIHSSRTLTQQTIDLQCLNWWNVLQLLTNEGSTAVHTHSHGCAAAGTWLDFHGFRSIAARTITWLIALCFIICSDGMWISVYKEEQWWRVCTPASCTLSRTSCWFPYF